MSKLFHAIFATSFSVSLVAFSGFAQAETPSTAPASEATSLAVVVPAAGEQAVSQPSTVSGAMTSCFVSPAKLPDSDIISFIAQPDLVFRDMPENGIALSSRIRALAGSSSATMPAIMGLLTTATPEQIAAIGSGLGRAARACERVNPEYAGAIQMQVASLNDEKLIAAFTTATNEIQTAALGAAGAASSVVSASDIGSNGDGGGGAGNGGEDDGVVQTSETYSVSRRLYFGSNDGGGSDSSQSSGN